MKPLCHNQERIGKMEISDSNDAFPYVHGKAYTFSGRIEATAYPVKGIHLFPPTKMFFRQGVFLLRLGDLYIFQGRPFIDSRPLAEADRECYFGLVRVSKPSSKSISILGFS